MMKTMILATAALGMAADATATSGMLDQFRWKNRILVVFADSNNASAARQENALLADRAGLAERDMVVLTVRGDAVRSVFGSGTDLTAQALRREIKGPPEGEFAAVLIGKDGGQKLRVRDPIVAAELFAVIDTMPMRAAEQQASKQ